MNGKIRIGTIGYHNLRNHSIGPGLLDQLKAMEWPANVDIEEMNWGPIAIIQQFEAMEEPYRRVILLAAVERERPIGEITVFRWKGGLPPEAHIQACIGDAVTGVISVQNLLIIGEYFNIWPEEVGLVDVEPGPEVAGEAFSPEVQHKIPQILSCIRELCLCRDWDSYPMKAIFGYI